MDATRIIKAAKVVSLTCLTVSVMFFSAVATVVLYEKYADKPALAVRSEHGSHPSANAVASPDAATEPAASPEPAPAPASAMLDAPLVLQYPELPRGCEVTSLTMLLQYYGYDIDKVELAAQLPMDPTPIAYNSDGSIRHWGDPNAGFVGDITLHAAGFGIYHAGLYPLLKEYVPSAVDLTGQAFEELEEHVAEGTPVLAWTTTTYTVPDSWVSWESPGGTIRTTFKEHAVLLVGYDEQHVYVNDPLKNRKQVKIPKAQFISSWEAMGKQALSYTVNEFK